MAFGDSVDWTADNTAETLQPAPVPTVSQFPPVKFDAMLVPPYNAEEEAKVAEDEQMRVLEDLASDIPPEVALALKTLIDIVGNKLMLESVRVRAAQLLLERHDKKTEIAALYARLEALEAAKTEAASDGELPPHLRRK